MKICLSADWHCHPWSTHARYNEFGVPDRLELFLTLAQDIRQLCAQRGVEHQIVAGDILQTHSPKPMVSNTVRAMFDVFEEAEIHTLVVVGNHDVDQKSGRFDDIHSGLAALVRGYKHVEYYGAPATVAFAGQRVYIHPWVHGEPNYDAMPEADIFVGHGIVQQSTDPHGHVFENGYDARRLGEHFRFSVIGDIHRGQVLHGENGSKTLIPGQPMQINHASDPNSGIWFLDTEDYSLEFVPTTEFPSADRYHRFLSVEGEPPTDAPANVHYKRKMSRKSADRQQVETEVVQVAQQNLLDVALSEFHMLKPEHAEEGAQLLRDAYEQVREMAPKERIHSNQRLGRLEIHDFYSIPDYVLDLQQMEGDVLIVGKNGHGKSSLVEAVFWCLTGENTKRTPVDQISNNVTGQPARVSLEVLDGKDVWKITRSRAEPLLTLEQNGVSQTKAKTIETQEQIYQLLGMRGASDLLSLIYFSVNQNKSFSDMLPSEQLEFLGRLTDSEQFEEFKRILSEQEVELSRQYSEHLIEQRTVQGLIEQREAQIAELSQRSATDVEQAAIARVNEHYGLELTNSADAKRALQAVQTTLQQKADACATEQEASNAENALRITRSAITQQENALSRTQVELTRIEGDIGTLTRRYEQALSNKCPECGQAVHDPDIQNRILAQVKEVGQRRKSLLTEVSAIEQEISALRQKEPGQATLAAQMRESATNRAGFEFQVKQAAALLLEFEAEVTDHAAKIQHYQDDIKQLKTRLANSRAESDKLEPRYRAAQLIKSKMLVKNSSMVQQMVSGVYAALVQTMNDMVGDRRLFHAKAVTGKKLDMKVSFRGEKPVTMRGMSAGERRLLDILSLFALNTMFERRFGLQDGILGVAFYDEIVTYLDPEYLDIVFSAIQNLQTRLRVMVTHDENLMSYYDKIIRVEKVDRLTRFTMINM